MRHRRVADRIRLGFGCFLPRLLRHRAFLDTDQRFAVGAVEDVDPAGAPRFGYPLARLTVDHRVEQYHRTRRVVVPDVVMDLLEMPDVFAGLGL